MRIKVDITQEYDTLSWDFIDKMLMSFGFYVEIGSPPCSKVPDFLLWLLEKQLDIVGVERGLKQGNPLSYFGRRSPQLDAFSS